MNFGEILEHEPDESESLEYKSKRADNTSIVKDLVALANNNGGELIYGIRESNGVIEEIQNITDYSQFEEDISQTITSRVDPVLPIEVRKAEYDESTVVGIEVGHNGLLHTFDTGNNKPCIPMRVGSTTDYLGGAALREFYRSRFESADSGLSGWLDEIRKQAHRITYSYEENDFREMPKRESFADRANEVARELKARLEKPHRDIDETTAQLMRDFVSSCEELLSSGLTTTKPPIRSTRGGEVTGGGHVSGYSMSVFRDKTKEVNKKATELKNHIEAQSKPIN
jgi:predicted HTH transcriptional regulator